MKTDKDLGLLGTTVSGDATDPPSTSQGWMPIETAPRDGSDILLYFPFDDDFSRCGAHRAAWSRGHWWMMGHHCGGQLTSEWTQPTHWMPLPSPPSGDVQAATVLTADPAQRNSQGPTSTAAMNERLWLRFLWTFALSDHLGDAAEAVRGFAKKAGLPIPGEYAELNAGDNPDESWLAWVKSRGITSDIFGRDEA